jgi:hypothetical protein
MSCCVGIPRCIQSHAEPVIGPRSAKVCGINECAADDIELDVDNYVTGRSFGCTGSHDLKSMPVNDRAAQDWLPLFHAADPAARRFAIELQAAACCGTLSTSSRTPRAREKSHFCRFAKRRRNALAHVLSHFQITRCGAHALVSVNQVTFDRKNSPKNSAGSVRFWRLHLTIW